MRMGIQNAYADKAREKTCLMRDIGAKNNKIGIKFIRRIF